MRDGIVHSRIGYLSNANLRITVLLTLTMIALPAGTQCHGVRLLKRNREMFGKNAVAPAACAIPLPVG